MKKFPIIKATEPTVADDQLGVSDIWIDISGNPVVKKCTSIAPVTFLAMAGGFIFMELDGSVSTTAAGQGLGDGAWGPWDISATVPADTVLILIGVKKHTASDICGVRKGGTALARTFSVAKEGCTMTEVLPSATRTIDIMSNDVSDADDFCIFGYWTP